jgi:Tol biopolymer transport system component
VENIAIWGLPIDANQGKSTGEIKRLTEATGSDFRPSVPVDGSKLVFVSNRSGNRQELLKDLESGRESVLTAEASPAGVDTAAISPDGSKVVYSVAKAGKYTNYLIPIGPQGLPGVAEKLCEDCLNVEDWTSDGKKVLLGGIMEDRRGGLMDVASRTQTELPASFSRGIGDRLSPDDRWVSFHKLVAPGRTQLFVAPVIPGVDESKPILVSDDRSWGLVSRWSPNQQLLYYLSDRDGSRCLWAQRLDAVTKQPVGPSFAVAHFHNPRRSPMGSAANLFTIAVTRNQIILPLNERTGNIWMGVPEARPQ